MIGKIKGLEKKIKKEGSWRNFITRVKRLSMAVILGLPLIFSASCAKKSEFTWRGMDATIKSCNCGYNKVIIKGKGNNYIKIKDFNRDSRIGEYDRVEIKKGNTKIEVMGIDKIKVNGIIYGKDSDFYKTEGKKLISSIEEILSDIYSKHYRHNAAREIGEIDSIKSEINLEKLIENNERVYFGEIPEKNEYKKIMDGSIIVESKSNIIRDLGSNDNNYLKFEKEYRESTLNKAKEEGIKKLLNMVDENYAIKIDNIETLYAGFDLDEKIGKIETHEKKGRSIFYIVDEKGWDSYKSVVYKVKIRISYSIYQTDNEK